MADKKYVLRILALALVFGFLVAGCDNGGTWENVTDLSQVKGTWKATYSTEEDYVGVQMNGFIVAPPASGGTWVVNPNYDPTDTTSDPGKAPLIFKPNTAADVIVLDDVTVETETEVTIVIAVTTATVGTITTTESITMIFSGDSLEKDFGYDQSITDPNEAGYHVARNGWSLIKNQEVGTYGTPAADTGFTVTDADYTISFATPANPAGWTPPGITPGAFSYVSSDGQMLMYQGLVYVKQQ